jgi:hypothetical protein
MARRYKSPRTKRLSQRRYRRTRKLYNDYLEQFSERKENFASRGLDFYDPTPLTYRDWKTVRQEKINDLKMDIEEGKRKSIGNVNREIVSDQAYELSSRQADVLGEYLLENEAETLEELDLVYKYTDEAGKTRINLKKKIELYMKIRQGDFLKKEIGLWDIINNFRSSLFENMSKNQQDRLIRKWGAKTLAEAVGKEVGQTFFNSPD